MITREEFEEMLPQVCAWARTQERRILTEGEALTPERSLDARAMGVRLPERIRVLRVQSIPTPEAPALRAAAAGLGFFPGGSAGMALGYGVFLQQDQRDARGILAHEFVHTGQYERLGGFEAFLTRYLTECLTVGYSQSPLEREAVTRSAEIGRRDMGDIG